MLYFYDMGEYSLAEAMQQFLSKSPLKYSVQAMEIEAVWEELMGKTIAKYTDKLELIQGTLIIHTSVAPLRNELIYQKEKISERVNEAMKKKLVTKVLVK